MSSLRTLLLAVAVGGVGVSLARAEAADNGTSAVSFAPLALVVAIVALIVGGAAIVVSLKARRLADLAAQEASEARARANQGGGGVSPESLAGIERVWAAKLSALEARIAGSAPRASVPRDAERASEGLTGRVEELERVVAGLAVSVKETRRPTVVPAGPLPPARDPHEPVWPACLMADTSAMNDVRQALLLALKSSDESARELLERLRAAESWSARKPGTAEVAAALSDVSSLLLAALRRGAGVAPLDGVLFSDRVLGALRPLWKLLHPQVDCRSFYPGTTFDPDWMEDHTRSGLQRPVIAEMLSWAVFEKNDRGRRILAKARVTAE